MPLTTTEARLIGLERRQKELEALLAQALAQIADLKARTQQAGVQQAGYMPGEVRLAKNGATAIPAATGNTPGSGTVRLWTSNATAAATDSGIDVTALNWADGTGQTVGANKKLKVIRIGADWWVFWELCP